MSIIDMNKEIFNEKMNDDKDLYWLNSWAPLVRLLQKNSPVLPGLAKAV